MPEHIRPQDSGELTAPHPPPGDSGELEVGSDPTPTTEPEPVVQDAPADFNAPAHEAPHVAKPEVVPGTYQYLKRWAFVFVVAGVWIAAAAVGVGIYQWWFYSMDKTASVFVLLIFLIVCTVGGLLTAMAQTRPLVSASSIALMSAPLAATAGAAVLHGLYFCDRVSRCLVGLIPY